MLGLAPRGEGASGDSNDERYARYVLFVLIVVYVVNYVDRQILAILLESIKADLEVSDTAMGFLTGTAFALDPASVPVSVCGS